MTRAIAIALCLAATLCHAEPWAYFEMRQDVTNDVMEDTSSAAVEITGILLTNANPYAQATNLAAAYAADPDYFGDSGDGELAYKAVIHWHDHYNPTPCVIVPIAEHASNHDKKTKWTVIEEDIANDPRWPDRYLPETFTLEAKNAGQAKQKENKVKAANPGKKWKPRKDHGI